MPQRYRCDSCLNAFTHWFGKLKCPKCKSEKVHKTVGV